MHDSQDVRTGMARRPLSPSERRQRNRQEMLDAILLHARQIMREQGVAALSLRELARRLRFTVQALYKYYPSKAALYDALFREGIRIASAQWNAAMASSDSFWEKIEAGIEGMMRFAHEYPELNELTFSRPVPGFVPSEDSMQESRRMLEGFDLIIENAAHQGELRSDVSRTEVRNLYLAMLDGLTRQHVANEPETPIGSGRYGSLIPAAIALFRSAWEDCSSTAVSRPALDR
ncbi:MAG: TetR/AcrR family transcriptional regulator [Chloroflexota bacterium]